MVDVGDQNDQTRHQYFEVVINTFCLRHPSLTYVLYVLNERKYKTVVNSIFRGYMDVEDEY